MKRTVGERLEAFECEHERQSRERLQAEVAAEFRLPLVAALSLSGSDREALRRDAAEIAAYLAPHGLAYAGYRP